MFWKFSLQRIHINAKKLLMHAFASEVIDTVKIEHLREYVEGKISKTFE